MRILLIEDEAETAAYLLKALRESGHVGEHAGDGESGLAAGIGCGYCTRPMKSLATLFLALLATIAFAEDSAKFNVGATARDRNESPTPNCVGLFTFEYEIIY